MDVYGENVYLLGQGSTLDDIIRDSHDFYGVLVLRLDFENGWLKNPYEINEIIKT